MLNIRDLKIDPASLGTKKLLVDITPAYKCKDGHRSDTITGYRYIGCTAGTRSGKNRDKNRGQTTVGKVRRLCRGGVQRLGSVCV